jgi:hypothetical protein
MYIDLYFRGEARPLSHLADDLNCGGLTRVQRAARNKGSSLPVTSFTDLRATCPPSPEVKIRSIFNNNRNSKFLNFHKSFSLGNYYRQEEEEEPKVKKKLALNL